MRSTLTRRGGLQGLLLLVPLGFGWTGEWMYYQELEVLAHNHKRRTADGFNLDWSGAA